MKYVFIKCSPLPYFFKKLRSGFPIYKIAELQTGRTSTGASLTLHQS
ncbi:MAG: hypothetical protein ACOCZ5_02340 [bacterium]